MKRKSVFNLDTALATWRHTLSHERYLQGEDLDELENHVRDQVKNLIDNGQKPKSRLSMKQCNPWARSMKR